jgi:predicted HTH transcriptional regulator
LEIAKAFKEAGIIERYGSGIMRVRKICREYNVKEPDFNEVSNGFQVVLYNKRIDETKNKVKTVEAEQELRAELRAELGAELQHKTVYSEILLLVSNSPLSKSEISARLGKERISGYLNRTLQKLLNDNLLKRTIPEKPNHPEQKFTLTERGSVFLKLIGLSKFHFPHL